ncbi:MAG: signal peptidase I [Gammaproteobacteria bacterium]|jgi:signal peptidase I
MKKMLVDNRAFIMILLGMICFRTAIADWSPVPSGSMEPTIWPGDVLLINKTLLGPNVPFTEGRLLQYQQPTRGDIVTLTPPGKTETFVKRVVGLPGDRIRMSDMQLIINDQPLSLQITDRGERTGIMRATEQLGAHSHEIQVDLRYAIREISDELTVPAGCYFVMGDFRNNSEDSRYFGFVNKDRVIGKVTRLAVSVAEERQWLTAPLLKLD